ncbi:hypothetical protein [Nakamurella sp. PAMC28650]|uniref:hypothetical protein n=1 Tax=Nakamurella sp. PAMC28650 TaxID=2762325 RepID=UPI00164D7C12|nr:hypothetical protein [Nakamurella sp. PAMC28650]QNK81086.1 hypothetical protein H7F38_23980 [Nakamurella sp. PAMC28650]
MTLREDLDARLAEFDARRAAADTRRADIRRSQDQLQQQPQAQHLDPAAVPVRPSRWRLRRRDRTS